MCLNRKTEVSFPGELRANESIMLSESFSTECLVFPPLINAKSY